MRKILIMFVVIGVSWAGCSNDREGFVPSLPQGEYVPTMTTRDVNTFISDSGYTRYHITSDVWRMYEDAPEPFWKFPDGLYLEQYDEELNPSANVVCDSATYYSRIRLWRLDGNVVMVNVDRDSFLTQQLFWDQTKQKVYSDSFIHIVRSDRIIEGYGFESNQNMTQYTVNRPTGIIPVSRPTGEGASTADTASTATPDSTEATPVSHGVRGGRRAAPVRASQQTVRIEPEDTRFKTRNDGL